MADETPKMEYRLLGDTGLRVSVLCLGCMTFGPDEGTNSWGMGVTSEESAHAMLDKFVEAGGNFIDTADVYGRGDSEVVLGNWIANQNRSSLVIATKVGGAMSSDPNDRGLSRSHIIDGLSKSLERLQTDYIDLFQWHVPDPDAPIEDGLRAMNELVSQGKIRFIGLSNYTAAQITEAVYISKMNGWAPISCLQPQYNLLCRSTEFDLIPTCEKYGLGVIPWSPLKGGLLSGRYRRGMDEPEEGSRVAWASKVGWKPTSTAFQGDTLFDLVDVLDEVAAEAGKTVAQVALRWLIQKPGVTAPIVGAKKMSHLEDNLGAAFFELSDDQMARLDAASAVEAPYPFGTAWKGSL